MRIGLASIHPRPLSGQIEGLVGLAQALSRHGHEVTLVSAFPAERLMCSERLQLAGSHGRSLVGVPARIASILRSLVEHSSCVDLIQLNLPTPAFSILGDLVQTLVRVPVVVYYEAHLASARDVLRPDLLRAALPFYLPRLLINNRVIAGLGARRAARYVVSSRYQKAELKSLGIDASRISLLPNLMPSDKLARPSPDSFRRRERLPSGRLLTYIGHYNHVKGVDVVTRAFPLLAQQFGDLHLVLAWSGQGRCPSVDALLKDRSLEGRVTQLGRVNVTELLAASDVVALPYRLTIGQAVYPAALLEALAARAPVVTSDLPLLREATNQGRTALLAPPEDERAFALAVGRLLQEPALVREMRRAQEEWLQRNHPQNVVKDYERLYEQVTARQARVLQPARDCEQVR